MKLVASIHHWSAGGALPPLDTIWTGYTLIGSAPTRWNRTCQCVQIGQFKSTSNGIHQWGEQVFPGTQYGRGQTSSTTTRSTFSEHRSQLSQSWNEERFSCLDQVLLMCETVDPSTSRSAQVACAAAIKTKNPEKTAREITRDKQKSPIRVKNAKEKRSYKTQ